MSDDVSAIEAHRKENEILRAALGAALPLLGSSRTYLDATMKDPTDHPLYDSLVSAIRAGREALAIHDE